VRFFSFSALLSTKFSDLHDSSFSLPDRIPRFAKCSYNVVVKARRDLPACIRPGEQPVFAIAVALRSLMFSKAFSTFCFLPCPFSLSAAFAHFFSLSVLPHETRYHVQPFLCPLHSQSHASSVASAASTDSAGSVAVKRRLPDDAGSSASDAVASSCSAVSFGVDGNGRCGPSRAGMIGPECV
jgi:hypothetical protein